MMRLKRAHWWKYIGEHWRRILLVGLGVFLVACVGVQLGYPWNKLPLYTVINGKDVSGWQKDDATWQLDKDYASQKVNIYFGESPKVYVKPLPKDIGLTIKSDTQVASASYPLWLRLVPTSLWWAHFVANPGEANYVRDAKTLGEYMAKALGGSCDVKAENASVKYNKGQLEVVPVINGGTCKIEDVKKTLSEIKPRFDNKSVRIAMDVHPAKIQNASAEAFIKNLTARTTKVAMKTVDDEIYLPQDTLLSWLNFEAPDEGIKVSIDAAKAEEYLTKQVLPKVQVKPGTSQVATVDFDIVSRVTGSNGRTLDRDATVATLASYLNGNDVQVEAVTKVVPPGVVFNRTYTKSDEGLQALLEQFAQDHPGTFGVKYIELSGAKRNAGYNETRVFETASTYKLFVAFSALKRIDDGRFHWSDQVSGGRDLTKCFDDMIVKSDNACAEALLYKIGQAAITSEIQALGLKSSTFLKSYIQSTANDEAIFLGSLANGQLPLTQESQNTLISAMKRNIFRRGIPAGASGQVADKVGFLYALLHDAAIVYSPSGTYVLVIMTDGSSWGTIADLTRKIEEFRAM